MYMDIGSIQKIGMDIGSIQTLDAPDSLAASGNLFIHGHTCYHSLYIPSVAPIIFGNESEFMSSGAVDYISTAALDLSKFIVAYQDQADNNHGTAKIGTVSGTTIIFGEETEFLNSGTVYRNAVTMIDSSKFVVVYTDNADNNHGTAKIGTVSGTTITFGEETEFVSSGGVSYIGIAKIDSSRFVVVYQDLADASHGTTKIGTVSGTTITFGEETEFVSSGAVYYNAVAMIDSSRFVVVYADGADNNYGTAKIGTVDGTTITFGEETEFLSLGSAYHNAVAMIDSSRFVVVYRDGADAGHGTAKIGTVDGTIITFDEETEFVSLGSATDIAIAMLDSSRFVVVYRDGADAGHGTTKIGTVDGTTITFGEETEFVSSGAADYNSVIQFNESKFVVVYKDVADAGHGTAKVGNLPVEYIPPGDLFISGPLQIIASGNLFIHGDIEISGISAPSLFIHGHIENTASGDLFVEGHIDTVVSGDLFINGHEPLAISGNLFIHGHTPLTSSGNLYIDGHEPLSVFGNLYIHGHLDQSSSGDLFIQGHESTNNNTTLYIDGIRVTSKIYACGDNTSRSLGVAAEVNRVTSLQRAFGNLFIKYPYAKYPVGWTEEEKPVAHRCPTTAACTPTQGACVDEDGNVWSVGTNTDYALGIGSTNESYITSIPIRVSGLPDVPFMGVRIGDRTNFAIAENGTVWAWGHNDHGELGIGNTINQHTAQQVSGMINTIDIDANAHHSVFVTSSGVFACGEYTDGKLGIAGVTENVLIPQQVSGLNGIEIVDVACGDDTTMFLTTSGDIYFCGKNNHGMFGDGTAKGVVWDVPTLSMSGILYGCPVDITCDTNSSAFICGSGCVYCAGYNRRGKFGNGESGGDYIDFIRIEQNTPSGVNIRMGDEASWLSCRDSASGVWAAGGTVYGEIGTTDGIPWTSWQQVPNTAGYLRMWGTEKQLVVYEAVIERILHTSKTADLYMAGPLLSPASGDLFIHGYDNIPVSGDLFTQGHETIQASGDLYTNGHESLVASGNLFMSAPEPINASGDLWTYGKDNIEASGNLFIEGLIEISGISAPPLFVHGHIPTTTSGNLFVHGHDEKVGSGNLFIRGPELTPTSGNLFIHGHNDAIVSGTLFIHGHEQFVASGDLYINGHLISSASGDLFTEGHEDIAISGDLFINGHIDSVASGNLFIEGYIDTSGISAPPLFINGHVDQSSSGNLFIRGHIENTASGDLFVEGHIDTVVSGDLFINGHEPLAISGNLFIHGHTPLTSSGNLYIDGHEPLSVSGNLYIHGHLDQSSSGNLFIHGHEDISISGDLFIEGHIDASGVPVPSLFIHGHDTAPASGDLFVHGHETYSGSMDLFIKGFEVKPIDWLLRSSDHYPQIIGTLEGATSATIQLWEITDGQNTPVSLTVSGCYQIGNTGRWAWSTANLPMSITNQLQYFYLMTADNSETFDGQFFLELPERAKWIYPSQRSDYIL